MTNYLADLRAFLRWSENTRDRATSPYALTPQDIQAYCVYLEQDKGHTPATVNRRLQTLRKFYDVAIAQGQTRSNPAEKVSLLKEVVSERSRSLTEQDIERLLAAIQRGRTRWSDRDRVIIQMLVGAGLKLGELIELRLQDVHLETNEPYLSVRGDGDDPGRTIPLSAEVYDALGSYLPVRQAAPGVDHLCVNRDGRPLSTRSIQRLLHHYAQAAGLDSLTTQSLRYVYARQVYGSCGDLKTVARLLGHRHLATTIRYLQPGSGPGE